MSLVTIFSRLYDLWVNIVPTNSFQNIIFLYNNRGSFVQMDPFTFVRKKPNLFHFRIVWVTISFFNVFVPTSFIGSFETQERFTEWEDVIILN